MSFKGMYLLGSGFFNIIKNYLVGIEKNHSFTAIT